MIGQNETLKKVIYGMADIFHKSICKTKMILFRGDPQPQLLWTRMGPAEVGNPYCFGLGDSNVYLFVWVC